MRSNKRPNRFSPLAVRLFTRYLLSLAVLFAAVVGGYFFAAFVCYRFTWSENDPLYYLLKVVEQLSPVLIVLLLLAGFVWFTVRALRQPLGYLDDVIAAAKSLSDPAAPPIELPKELSDVENELNLARSRLQENLRARREAEQRKNDLIMYLAHDLKTPLSSVIGYLTLLHDEGEIAPALREKYLSIALDKANRLEDLINEFFEITRFNLSAIELQYGAADLSRLLEQLTFEFQPMLREKNLTCALSTPETFPIRCDANKLQRVFDNLLRNAVLYCYPGTEITVTAERVGNFAVVRFRNHGDTIPPEKLSRIFEQFYRLDTVRSSTGGAGLGLAIARQITQLHGGSLTGESRDDTVTFTVTLPIEKSTVGKS